MKTRPQPREYWKCWVDDGADDYTIILKKLNKGWRNGKAYVAPGNVEALCRMIKDVSDNVEEPENAQEQTDEDEEGENDMVHEV